MGMGSTANRLRGISGLTSLACSGVKAVNLFVHGTIGVAQPAMQTIAKLVLLAFTWSKSMRTALSPPPRTATYWANTWLETLSVIYG